MDEINEQTENMKQIPEAFSAPTHFDEVIVLLMPFHFSQVLFSCQKKKTFSFLFELPINWALWFSVGDTPNVFVIAGWIGSCEKMLQINKPPSKLEIYSF
jgi:hypothetical protein